MEGSASGGRARAATLWEITLSRPKSQKRPKNFVCEKINEKRAEVACDRRADC